MKDGEVTVDETRCPKPRRRGVKSRGWSAATVRDVLHNELYKGVLITGKTKKRNVAGEIATTMRPREEWIEVQREDLRIVSDDLWNAAHARGSGGRVRS